MMRALTGDRAGYIHSEENRNRELEKGEFKCVQEQNRHALTQIHTHTRTIVHKSTDGLSER